jgi:hypothetical protein
MGTVFIGYVNALDLHMDNNLYVQGASPYAAVWGYFYPGPDVRYRYDTAEAPGGRRKWFNDHGQDEHSLCSVDGKSARFVNQDSADYRLSQGSDCIDRGTNVSLTLDFDRQAVPQGSAPDIGAYEWLVGTPTLPPAPTGVSAVPE